MMKRARDIFSAIFNEGQMKEAGEYSAFFSCWNDLVEKNGIAAAAAHSRIKTLEKGLVWIEVDHPGWKQILQTKKSKLLSDFHYRFPKMAISGISIVLCRPDSLPADVDIVPVDMDSVPVTPVMQEEVPPREQPADSAYEAIKDTALRDVLMRLERRIIESQQTG